MKVIRIIVLPLEENTYLYYDEISKDGVVIDPGGDTQRIVNEIEKNEIKLQAILLTHGHYDHIGAVEALKEKYHCPVVSHKDEVVVTNDAKINLSCYRPVGIIEFTPDVLVQDGEKLQFGTIQLKVIHTPGHTPGGCCYLDEKNQKLFSGDTLFHENIGRTDLELSDTESILYAIRNKLFRLDKDTVVYPGHDCETSIGHEKQHNPYV